MSLGVKRGTVQLEPHDKRWDDIAIGGAGFERIMSHNEQLQNGKWVFCKHK